MPCAPGGVAAATFPRPVPQAGNPDNSAEKLLHNVFAHSPDSLVNQGQVELALAVRRFVDRIPPARTEKEAEAEH